MAKDFNEEKERLLSVADFLLGRVYPHDFGMDLVFDDLNDNDRKTLEEWYRDVEEFAEVYGLKCHGERLRGIGPLADHNQVSKVRIQETCNIVERI